MVKTSSHSSEGLKEALLAAALVTESSQVYLLNVVTKPTVCTIYVSGYHLTPVVTNLQKNDSITKFTRDDACQNLGLVAFRNKGTNEKFALLFKGK